MLVQNEREIFSKEMTIFRAVFKRYACNIKKDFNFMYKMLEIQFFAGTNGCKSSSNQNLFYLSLDGIPCGMAGSLTW